MSTFFLQNKNICGDEVDANEPRLRKMRFQATASISLCNMTAGSALYCSLLSTQICDLECFMLTMDDIITTKVTHALVLAHE